MSTERPSQNETKSSMTKSEHDLKSLIKQLLETPLIRCYKCNAPAMIGTTILGDVDVGWCNGCEPYSDCHELPQAELIRKCNNVLIGLTVYENPKWTISIMQSPKCQVLPSKWVGLYIVELCFDFFDGLSTKRYPAKSEVIDSELCKRG